MNRGSFVNCPKTQKQICDKQTPSSSFLFYLEAIVMTLYNKQHVCRRHPASDVLSHVLTLWYRGTLGVCSPWACRGRGQGTGQYVIICFVRPHLNETHWRSNTKNCWMLWITWFVFFSVCSKEVPRARRHQTALEDLVRILIFNVLFIYCEHCSVKRDLEGGRCSSHKFTRKKQNFVRNKNKSQMWHQKFIKSQISSNTRIFCVIKLHKFRQNWEGHKWKIWEKRIFWH